MCKIWVVDVGSYVLSEIFVLGIEDGFVGMVFIDVCICFLENGLVWIILDF